MVFGQLSNRESLRDLIIALEAHQSMCYHLRLGRVNLWPKLHLQQLAKTEITESSKICILHDEESLRKRATHILNIQGKKYAFRYAWLHSLGLNFVVKR